MTSPPKPSERDLEIARELAKSREMCGYDHDYAFTADVFDPTCCDEKAQKQATLIATALAQARREGRVAVLDAYYRDTTDSSNLKLESGGSATVGSNPSLGTIPSLDLEAGAALSSSDSSQNKAQEAQSGATAPFVPTRVSLTPEQIAKLAGEGLSFRREIEAKAKAMTSPAGATALAYCKHCDGEGGCRHCPDGQCGDCNGTCTAAPSEEPKP